MKSINLLYLVHQILPDTVASVLVLEVLLKVPFAVIGDKCPLLSRPPALVLLRKMVCSELVLNLSIIDCLYRKFTESSRQENFHFFTRNIEHLGHLRD